MVMYMNYDNISNSALAELIDNWIKGERNRAIMKRRLIDGICFEPLAEEFELSPRNVRYIVNRCEKIIHRHIDSFLP